jgi:hypothetical protein
MTVLLEAIEAKQLEFHIELGHKHKLWIWGFQGNDNE